MIICPALDMKTKNIIAYYECTELRHISLQSELIYAGLQPKLTFYKKA
jgi:hypothetical protein